uniref:uncharacterized protein isoform X2 n=1 Tax=Pristiophorus japonicus TaxID=55135 RepID=UPI00398E4701
MRRCTCADIMGPKFTVPEGTAPAEFGQSTEKINRPPQSGTFPSPNHIQLGEDFSGVHFCLKRRGEAAVKKISTTRNSEIGRTRDSDDSDHSDTDDRPSASTFGITQPSPDEEDEDEEGEEQEEPLIRQPVELGVETEEDTPAPCGRAGTSSTMESVFRDSPVAPLILRDQAERSKAPPVLQRLCHSNGGWCRKGQLL